MKKRIINTPPYDSDDSRNHYERITTKNKPRRKDSIEGSYDGSSYRSSDEESDISHNANNRKLVLKDNSAVNNNNYIQNGNDPIIMKDQPEISPYEDLDKYEPKEIPNDIVTI